jgi:hypothetical protein
MEGRTGSLAVSLVERLQSPYHRQIDQLLPLTKPFAPFLTGQELENT